jgi:bla regulator protein blaR1
MKILEQMLLTFLLNASWQVSLIVTFAVVCDWLLRGVAARYRHLLWVMTLLACLAMPIWSSLRFARETMVRESSTTQDSVRPIVTSRILTPGVEIGTQSAARSVTAPPSDERKPSDGASSIRINPKLALWLTMLYALLVLWRIASLFRAWHRTRVILKSAFACDFSELFQATLDDCQTVIRTRPFRLLCSAEVPVPVTVGVFRRIIILPQRFVREVNQDVLRSAIGHELVHVARRDYLTNLVFEFLYIPLSFHPAAAFARRRIKHTRELCCDETVAAKLIQPEVYARSLISLIGSAPIWRPLAPDTTIGINESDILEVRIMSLLNTRKFSPRRRVLLLIAAALLLTVPCVAAARFALNFDARMQEPATVSLQEQKEIAEQRAREERALVELLQQRVELKEQMKRTPEGQRAEMEGRLREVERNLEEHKRMLEKSARGRDLLAKVREESIADEDERVRATKEMLETALRLQGNRKARLIYHFEPSYPSDAREKKIEGSVVLRFTVNHEGVPQSIQVKQPLYPSLDQAAVETVGKWRFEPAMKDGQPVSMWMEAEVNFNLNQEPQTGQAIKREGQAEYQGQEYKVRLSSEGQRAEEGAKRRDPAELARQAKISMDHAIQIATSKVPGKVMECSLLAKDWVRSGESYKPTEVFYCVTILSADETNPATHFVLVNATDGSIFKDEKYERKRANPEALFLDRSEEKAVNGGVLNSKANSLPAPEYPAIARQARASGSVNVEVLIDEGGNVVAARSVSGHPLLQAAAVTAARQATFAPTRYNGEPVMVRGIIVYNFVAQ